MKMLLDARISTIFIYSNPKWVYDPMVCQKPGFLKKPGFSDSNDSIRNFSLNARLPITHCPLPITHYR